MTKHTPEQINFESLLSTSDVSVNVGQLAVADRGFSSTVFFTHDHVVKVLRSTFQTSKSAHDYADILYGEQETIRHYLRPANIAVAHFVVGRAGGEDYRVSLVQDRVEGVSMQRTLVNGGGEVLGDYLSDALRMYRITGQIPDLACLERRFDPMNDPNTKVITKEGKLEPVLVDTTYGRLQRRRYAGRLISKGIAVGVKSALDKLGSVT